MLLWVDQFSVIAYRMSQKKEKEERKLVQWIDIACLVVKLFPYVLVDACSICVCVFFFHLHLLFVPLESQ